MRTSFSLDECKSVLNRLVGADGSLPQMNLDKVVISLVNVEKRGKAPVSLGYKSVTDAGPGKAAVGNHTLFLLVSSNFYDYAETLKFLDMAIGFFEANAVIEAGTFPDIPQGIAKLEFAVESTPFDQLQNIWEAIGAKYQPSVVYKLTITVA